MRLFEVLLRSYWCSNKKFQTFLVGAFLVKRARLLQWLVFFRQTIHSSRMYLFCEIFTFTKSTQYFILIASKSLYLETQNPEASPLPMFRRYETFPPLFRLCETFRNFLVFKGSPSIFWCFAPEWMLKKPKGPPFCT